MRVEVGAELGAGKDAALDRFQGDHIRSARTAVVIERLELAHEVARPEDRDDDFVTVERVDGDLDSAA